MMRDILRTIVDCLLLGLAVGVGVMVLAVVLDLGGLQARLEAAWLGGPSVLMIAVFSGCLTAGAQITLRLVRAEMRADREAELRRRLLIPAQRRRR